MKQATVALAVVISFSISTKAQTINNTNYYSFQKDDGSFDWLRSSDAIPIIIDELIKKGIPNYDISVGKLLKLNDSTRLVVSVSFEKNDKEFGFVYEATHGIPLSISDRDFLRDKTKAGYTENERDAKGGMKFMRIDDLPANIMLLKETCYWFQFDIKDTKNAVTKDVAAAILRQDVDDYLTKL